DPQQRLLLEVGFEACAAGGLDSLQDADVGTFTGLMNSDAIALAPEAHDLNAYVMMGNGYSAAGARLSYAFALRGPCLVLDTACSSSLIACHTGRRSLQHDECALALVAAPNLMLLAGYQHLGTAIMGMNSATGRCHTMDDRADGFVRGEGGGAMLLSHHDPSTLDAAATETFGSAAKHNGRSASFTALNGLSQQRLLKAALRDGSATAESVAFLEQHGTGTPLGDP
ncbi:hypothetical protein AURANDRAFT_5850, partial [Aureococcus anophagefferens]